MSTGYPIIESIVSTIITCSTARNGSKNQADEPKEAHIFRHERIFTILGGIRKATEAVYEGEIIGGFMQKASNYMKA